MSGINIYPPTEDSRKNRSSFDINKYLEIHEVDRNKSKNNKNCNGNPPPNPNTIIPENQLFADMMGKDILVILDAVQLNILGQVFRPIFTGRVTEVTNGSITLDPVIIKMNTAPFYKFPTPLSFPMENIAYFTEFDPETRISIP